MTRYTSSRQAFTKTTANFSSLAVHKRTLARTVARRSICQCESSSDDSILPVSKHPTYQCSSGHTKSRRHLYLPPAKLAGSRPCAHMPPANTPQVTGKITTVKDVVCQLGHNVKFGLRDICIKSNALRDDGCSRLVKIVVAEPNSRRAVRWRPESHINARSTLPLCCLPMTRRRAAEDTCQHRPSKYPRPTVHR